MTPGPGQPPGEVILRNSPAFAYQTNLVTHLPDLDRPLQYDIAFGGNFFALMDVSQLNLKIHSSNSAKLIHYGMLLRESINREVEITHPLYPDLKGVDLVEFYEPPSEKLSPTRNTVVFGNHQLDRSPCGTGTSAKMALLAQKGQLHPGERYCSESITGAHFEGWIEPGPQLGKYSTWIPYIQGKAFITGLNRWVGEEKDPFMKGFLLARE
jgi:proline racemase